MNGRCQQGVHHFPQKMKPLLFVWQGVNCYNAMTDKCAKRQKRLKRLLYVLQKMRGESGGRTSVARSDATQMIKKTSFGIPYPINNPPIRAGMQKKMLQASQWTKTLKNVCHTFLLIFVNCNSNTLECCPNFGVLNYWNFFSIFPTV